MSSGDSGRRISDVDRELFELLEERTRLVRQARPEGPYAVDPQADARVTALIQDHPEASLPAESLRELFRQIEQACAAPRPTVAVAYFGAQGSFAHIAATTAFGAATRYSEAPTIPAVFDAVDRSSVDFGVAPIENSTEGGVPLTLDCLLAASDVQIYGELALEVSQCLLAQHGDLGRIQRVYSHPQALAQCRGWLSQNLPHAQLVVAVSTSAAAKEAAADDTVAAISSRLAAELNGLQVVRDSIQDLAHNVTRFVVLARRAPPPSGTDKTSLAFSTPHERGALKRILEIFDEEAINLTRIESRPGRERLWEYVFFADLVGHSSDEAVNRALGRLHGACAMVKVLGSYPRAG
jgi:chorismate mutase/prephenate dehydratase